MREIIMVAPTPFFSDRGCHIRVLNSYFRVAREETLTLLLTYPLGRDVEGIRTKRVPRILGYQKLDPGFSPYKPFLDLFLLIRISIYHLCKRPNALYCHLHEGALAGIIVKKLFGPVEVIFDSQGSLSGELVSNGTVKNRLIIWVLDRIEGFIINHSDRVITSTCGLRERYTQLSPYKSIEVIPDLPDTALFNPNIVPIKREELGLPHKKTVAYLGGLRKNKGIDYLLESIPRVSDEIHFFLMGYPLDEVRMRIKQLGVEKRVTLIGPIPYERAASHLRIADVAVSPKILSDSGEANAKLYIYNAVGLPVVCFDTEENRSVLGDRGYYAVERDSADMAIQIERACGIRD